MFFHTPFLLCCRTTGRITPLPNADIKYLATGLDQFMGYIVVVRGKAPTFANGNETNPQVRYWGFCKLAIPSSKTVDCLRDEEITLDEQGRYNIVVASTRPPGEGFDFLNSGPSDDGALTLRNMLPSASFYPMSVQNVNSEDDEDTVRAKMKEYFPEKVYCTLEMFLNQGIDACFDTA